MVEGTWGKILTGQQRLFVDKYFEYNCNATRAAQAVGYCPNGTENDWAATGSRLLRNVKVQEEMARRWQEKGMGADEVIGRLCDQARGNIATVIDVTVPGGMLKAGALKKHGHLIKSISWTQTGVRVEFYSSQKALELVGKTQGIFSEHIKVEMDWQQEAREAGLEPSDVFERYVQAAQAALEESTGEAGD